MLCQHVMFSKLLQISSGVLHIYDYLLTTGYSSGVCSAHENEQWIDVTISFCFGCSESPERKGKITVQMKQV